MYKMQTDIDVIIHDELMLLPDQDSENYEFAQEIEEKCEKFLNTLNDVQKAMFDHLRSQINLYQVLRDFEIISYTIDFLREIKI